VVHVFLAVDRQIQVSTNKNSVVNYKNIGVEIQARLMAGNRCYYALENVLKSKNISRKANLNIYIYIYNEPKYPALLGIEDKENCYLPTAPTM
jgi:hypothetical protein